MSQSKQQHIDRYYKNNGDCCAGCDWWRWHNTAVGDCTKSAPVSPEERYSMLGIDSCSLPLDAGHILTTRNHVCGDFIDSDKIDVFC